MGYVERSPTAALRSLVSCTWAMSGTTAPHRVLPDGCIDILVMPDGQARVVGTMGAAIVVPPAPGLCLGIRFRPGEAARLLPEAPRELTDGDALLTELWGDEGRRLEDVLGGACAKLHASCTDLLAAAEPLLERLLVARLTKHAGPADLRVRAATDALAAQKSVQEAAMLTGLSERQLTRRFRERVGTTPKLFGRVMRLLRARELLGAHDLADVATLAGYADQAHFTRDASALAGTTPARLVREMSGSAAA